MLWRCSIWGQTHLDKLINTAQDVDQRCQILHHFVQPLRIAMEAQMLNCAVITTIITRICQTWSTSNHQRKKLKFYFGTPEQIPWRSASSDHLRSISKGTRIIKIEKLDPARSVIKEVKVKVLLSHQLERSNHMKPRKMFNDGEHPETIGHRDDCRRR